MQGMFEGQVQRSSATPQMSSELRQRIHTMVARTRPRWAEPWEEDIVQLAMIRLARALERRPQETSIPAAYLRRVAYTATLDEVRRLTTRSRAAAPLERAESSVDEHDPARTVEAQQTVHAIRCCLARLIPARREAVLLYLEGNTVNEAAAKLGWSPKRTENLVYRGLADLRRALSSRGIRP